MADFGIICEVNPMHNGHKYLIDEARRVGAERVICIMSGNTVQRGELAIIDKYTRAKALVECGADLVIELPFPWCSSSAEYFALAGVSIAKNFCDTLIFGSESGNIDALILGAYAAADKNFRYEYKTRLSNGEQAAKVYRELLEKRTNTVLSSNDLLGIEYIRASLTLECKMNFVTVSRKGDGYNDVGITNTTYPSATAVRQIWENGLFNETHQFIPNNAFKVYKKAIDKNRLVDFNGLDAAILAFFRLKNGDELNSVAGADSGLANRFCEKATDAISVHDLLNKVKTKRYTDAHLRRFMLYCLAGVTEEDIRSLPQEALLLAANSKGRELLSKTRRSDDFSIVTKPADLHEEYRQNILSKRIDMIYTLAHKEKLPGHAYMKMKPYIK